MKYVPKAEREEWHERAMDKAAGSELDSAIELFGKTREWDRLAEKARAAPDRALEEISHYITEPAAKKLEKSHPGVVARLWRAQAFRIAGAAKSKHYHAALANFKRARLLPAGRLGE